MITPRRLLTVGFLLGSFLACLRPAMGASVSSTQAFSIDTSAPTQTLQFLPFDTSLGVLTGVQVALDATRRYELGLWNTGDTATPIDYENTLANSLLKVNGHDLTFSSITLQGVTGVLPAVSPADALAEAGAGFARFQSGQAADFGQAANITSDTPLAVSGSLPFLSGGNPWLEYSNGVTAQLVMAIGQWSFATKSDAYFTALALRVSGDMKVTYLYDKASTSVPEGGAGFAGITAIAALCVFRLRKARLAPAA